METLRRETDEAQRGCGFWGCKGDEALRQGGQNQNGRGKKSEENREEENGIGGSGRGSRENNKRFLEAWRPPVGSWRKGGHREELEPDVVSQPFRNKRGSVSAQEGWTRQEKGPMVFGIRVRYHEAEK